jgi:hypothetical protein
MRPDLPAETPKQTRHRKTDERRAEQEQWTEDAKRRGDDREQAREKASERRAAEPDENALTHDFEALKERLADLGSETASTADIDELGLQIRAILDELRRLVMEREARYHHQA